MAKRHCWWSLRRHSWELVKRSVGENFAYEVYRCRRCSWGHKFKQVALK